MTIGGRRTTGTRLRRGLVWGGAVVASTLLTHVGSAQSLRYRPWSSAMVISTYANAGVRFPQTAPTVRLHDLRAHRGGHGARGALLGLAIGAGAGLGGALLLNEIDPPGEPERLIGLPLLLGICGLVVGYGVGRGS